jgi:hypothetical protein
VNEPLTTERGSVTVHPGGVDQSPLFRLPGLDGRYYWLDGVLYVNTDHRLATELTADGPQLPCDQSGSIRETTGTDRGKPQVAFGVPRIR